MTNPKFYLWCRLGRVPLQARTFAEGVDLCTAYAVKYGLTVSLLDAESRVVCHVPPTLLSSAARDVVFGGVRLGTTGSN